MKPMVSLGVFDCFAGVVSMFQWFLSGVSLVSAVPVILFRGVWF